VAVPDLAIPPPAAVGRVSRGRATLAVAAACAAAGCVLLWLAFVTMGSASAWAKAPVFAAGGALVVHAIGRVGTRLRGARFQASFALSIVWLVALVLAAVFADLLPLGNHNNTSATIGVQGYARPDLFSDHPLGTNNFGLDLLARAIYGARVSLLTVALTVVVSLAIGGAVGLVAGYFRGAVDTVVGIFADAALAIPALVVLIAFAAMLGPPTRVPEAVLKTSAALAIVGIPTMIRLARANTLVVAQREFVQAARTLGARDRRIIVRELLPNVALPLVSYAFVVSAVLIVAEGSLSFLGLGLQQPEPSWGNMIAEGGLRDLRNHPHVALVPGAFMFATVYALNVVGDRARSAWSGREAKI
jgi:peptide/nickel transport system permease protein